MMAVYDKIDIVKIELISGRAFRLELCDVVDGEDNYTFIRKAECGRIVDIIPKNVVEHIRLYDGRSEE